MGMGMYGGGTQVELSVGQMFSHHDAASCSGRTTRQQAPRASNRKQGARLGAPH